MAGKERGSFRPLGLRMQDFGRRLMRHYVSPQSTPPPQNFALSPGWQADTQTPLIWDEPEQQETPPAEEWSVDIPPAVDAPPAAPRPARRKTQPSAQPPTVQRKDDPEQKIDPRLLAILAAHQERETRVAEIRERKTAASDLQRQADEGNTDLPAIRRRNRASFDYVETKALLPPDEEMGRSAPPKTPPGNVIQPARESDQPEDDDSEESSQAGITDTHVSQPIDPIFPSDVVADNLTQPVVQRAVDNDPESADLTPEELPQFPDDEPETEPVYPAVYGLPEFPRVAEEPELFGEREIMPPPVAPAGETAKPESPVSHSTDTPAPLQREMMPNSASLYMPDSQAEFSPPAETDSHQSLIQREIDAPPAANVRRREKPSSTAQPPVNQSSRIQRQQPPPEINAPTPESPAWESSDTDWPSSPSETDDGMMDAESGIEMVDSFTPAQSFMQREIEPSAEVEQPYWNEPETETSEESAPPVFNQTESPISTETSPSSKPPRIQRQPQHPPDVPAIQPDMGQGSDAAYDQYADTEPIESAFIQRDFDAALDEPGIPTTSSQTDDAPPTEAPLPTQRPVVQRKTASPPDSPPAQPSREQGDQTADTSFESGFVQREYDDEQPTINEDYWSEPAAEAPSDEGESPIFAAPESGFVQRHVDDIEPTAEAPSDEGESPTFAAPESGFVQREFDDIEPIADEDYWSEAEAEATPDEGIPSTFAAPESGFVQRHVDDIEPVEDEGYWSEAEATPDETTSSVSAYPADNISPLSAEMPPPPERPVVQRKTQSPPATTPENMTSDYIPVEYPDIPEQIEAPFEGEWGNIGDELPFDGAADAMPDAPPSHFMSSPPNQIARQPDFAPDIDQPPSDYDAYSEEESENREQPVDVFQALVSAGMISPPVSAPRIDRQATAPEEDDDVPDEDTFSEEPYSPQQPVDLYQAMMNSGMVPSSASYTPATRQGEIARKMESPQESRSSNPEPDRLPVQYAAEPNRVMRVQTDSSTTESNSTEQQKSGDMDIDKLARDVYNTLRERLRVEKERRG